MGFTLFPRGAPSEESTDLALLINMQHEFVDISHH